MVLGQLIDKIRLFTGDTKETRYTTELILSELDRCLKVISEATKVRVERSEIIQLTANKTVYLLPQRLNIIETIRFEQLAPRTVSSEGDNNLDRHSNVLSDNIQVLSESDLASRNFEPVDDLTLDATYGFRRDSSKSTVSAIVKGSLEDGKIEIYPRLTSPSITITEDDIELWTNNADFTPPLAEGEHEIALLQVYFHSYLVYDFSLANIGSLVNMTDPIIRMLEYMTAMSLLSFDTNSNSLAQSEKYLLKYKAELEHFKQRKASEYHDHSDDRHKVRKRRGSFGRRLRVGGHHAHSSDFGLILPIRPTEED